MKRIFILLIILMFLAGFADKPNTEAAPQAVPEPFLIKDVNPNLNAGSDILELTRVNDTVFFTADDGSAGRELWKSDGTEAGTVMVRDILTDTLSSEPAFLVDVGGTLFFAVDTTGSGNRNALWKSDGTSDGTEPVKDFYGGTEVLIESLTNVNGVLFFAVDDSAGSGNYQLWKSDGTEATTTLLANFIEMPSNFSNMNGKLYFRGNDNVSRGAEPWVSGGTSSNTTHVTDICAGGCSSNPTLFTYFNNLVFFSATDGTLGHELWRTNGTAGGTRLVEDINLGSNPSDINYPMVFNGRLFFAADDGANGMELWISDGSTIAGTELVIDINQTADSFPSLLMPYRSNLFFNATDGTNGYQLWMSDGSENGTVPVTSLSSGLTIYEMKDIYGTLFMVADGDNYGKELWKSNGTPTGTVRISDIYPSTGHGFDTNYSFVELNGKLLFAATNGSGVELWGLDLTDLSLSKDVSPTTPVSPEQEVNYTLSFRNDGHINATGVVITDSLPTQYLGDIRWSVDGISVTLTGSDPYVWQVENMAPGDDGSIEITAVITYGLAGGFSFANSATIAADQPGESLVNNTDVVTVTVANVAPVANDDEFEVSRGVSATLEILDNDTDLNGDILTVSNVVQPAHGMVKITDELDGVVYQSDESYIGEDSFSYSISDGYGGVDTATVQITVKGTASTVYLPMLFRSWPPVFELDDAPNTCAEALDIQMYPAIYRDNFDDIGGIDFDYYRFSATQGENYLAQIANVSEIDYKVNLFLYDTNCNLLENLVSTTEDNLTYLEWAHDLSSGNYTVLVYEAYGNSGPDYNYEFFVRELP